MKDLHIVVVSWNVREELERCLRSLSDACGDLKWECVVIDNASTDGSAQMVKDSFNHEPRIDIIENKINMGFSRACNQGAAHHQARNVLLLNPDTECPVNSLKKLVQKIDSRKDIGIIGPKILYPDGKYQQCVWRFPTLIDQALILLKLHHLIPNAKPLQKYFHKDLDPNAEQEVDQVMGACFLVKSACWEQIKGLDQRYFIWFEEVDACKQAKEKGWKVYYDPSVAVIHYGGQSFAKAFTLRKQMYFNDSLLKYMRKWHGFFAWLVILFLHPISLFLAWLVGIGRSAGLINRSHNPIKNNKKRVIFKLPCQQFLLASWHWFLILFALETLSLITNQYTLAQSLIVVVLGVFVAITAYRKPALALIMVAIELLIGGFGYLFSFNIQNVGLGISLRLIMMAGFFLGWGINALQNRIWKFWRIKELFILQAWVGVMLLVFIGIFRGLQLQNQYLYQDANAWFFLFYFLPVLDIAHRYAERLKIYLQPALLAAVVWICLKVLLTFYIFTHSFWGLEYWYTWIRDTRVGEITPAGNGLYRIFFQSAIYEVFIIFFVFSWWVTKKNLINNKIPAYAIKSANQLPIYISKHIMGVLWVLSFSVILLSLSRSFWLGTGLGGVLLLGLSIYQLKKIPKISITKAIVGSFSSIVLIALIMLFPWPNRSQGDLVNFFASRGSVSDAAASSRWNLLPAMIEKIKTEPILGHGFGSTVTYKSQDPRVLKQNPDGWFTTYAFEWGWLSFYIKFGIFGIPIMLWLLVSLSLRIWKAPMDWWLRSGAVASVFALAVIHFFTPYLDHPLGFAWLLSLEGVLAMVHDDRKIFEFNKENKYI